MEIILRDGRCCSSGSDAPAKAADKQKIKADVDDGGDDQIHQRMATVAYSLHNTCTGVVENEGQ